MCGNAPAELYLLLEEIAMPMVHLPPFPQKTLTFIILIFLHFLAHEAKGLYDYLPFSPGARYANGAHTRPNISSYSEVKLKDEF